VVRRPSPSGGHFAPLGSTKGVVSLLTARHRVGFSGNANSGAESPSQLTIRTLGVLPWWNPRYRR
jgi:hypothetical protein